MNLRGVLMGILSLIIIGMLAIYFFVPLNTLEFTQTSENSNFNLNTTKSKMQFYDNMRYFSNEISYRIEDCPLQKRADMEESFRILESKTMLRFYEVDFDEEIIIGCDSKTKIEGGLFIAGEGGPTNITISGDFNLIYGGKILLIKESSCPKPNIGLHELLHALGFDHSNNPDNIMYEISKCRQTIGDDIPILIDKLYSIPNYPDLSFENVSINMEGKYLNANLSIRNNGLRYSEEAILIIYADDKKVKEINIEPLDLGYGTKLSLLNTWISKLSVSEIKFVLETNFEELDKSNNEIVFAVKE